MAILSMRSLRYFQLVKIHVLLDKAKNVMNTDSRMSLSLLEFLVYAMFILPETASALEAGP